MSGNPFDDLTLAEVDELTTVCLGGLSFEDASPINVAGAVMFMTERRTYSALTWEEFRTNTKMGAIKEFSDRMNADAENPTNGVTT